MTALRRLIVFTGLERFEESPWWPVLLATPGVEAILVCRQLRVVTPRSALRSVRRNLRKHGLLFLPWRIGHALLGQRGPRPQRRWAAPDRSAVRVERIESGNLHAPEVVDAVRRFAPDLGVSIGAPILRRELFGAPARGTVNVHSGKVPDFRGAPPGFWELYTGARELGATVHWMDEGLDTGPIVDQATAPIYPHDSLARVEARAEELALTVLRRALSALARGIHLSIPQPAGGTTYRQPTVRQRLTLAARTLGARLRRRVLSARSAGRLVISLALLGVVRPVRDAWRTARGRHPVRMFTFHRVTDLCRDGMTVSPAVFERQVAYMKKHLDVVSLEHALALLRTGARLRRPVAVITFDDGYRSVYDSAAPVLRHHAVVGCGFVCTDFAGTDRRFDHDATNPARQHCDVMDWDEIQRLQREGWSIGGHTANHVRLSACDPPTLARELRDCLTALRERLGLRDVALAYPFGGPQDITPAAVDQARACGYAAVLSDFDGENVPGDDLFALGRFELGGDHDPIAWRAKIHALDIEQIFLVPRPSGAPVTMT